jgi:hypothetical protein
MPVRSRRRVRVSDPIAGGVGRPGCGCIAIPAASDGTLQQAAVWLRCIGRAFPVVAGTAKSFSGRRLILIQQTVDKLRRTVVAVSSCRAQAGHASSASAPQGVDDRSAPGMTMKARRRSVSTNLRSAVAIGRDPGGVHIIATVAALVVTVPHNSRPQPGRKSRLPSCKSVP